MEFTPDLFQLQYYYIYRRFTLSMSLEKSSFLAILTSNLTPLSSIPPPDFTWDTKKKFFANYSERLLSNPIDLHQANPIHTCWYILTQNKHLKKTFKFRKDIDRKDINTNTHFNKCIYRYTDFISSMSAIFTVGRHYHDLLEVWYFCKNKKEIINKKMLCGSDLYYYQYLQNISYKQFQYQHLRC